MCRYLKGTPSFPSVIHHCTMTQLKSEEKPYYKKDSFYCYHYDHTIFIELFQTFDLDSEDPFLLFDYLDSFEGATPQLFINWNNSGIYKAIGKIKEMQLLERVNSSLHYNMISLCLRQFCVNSCLGPLHEHTTIKTLKPHAHSTKNKKPVAKNIGQRNKNIKHHRLLHELNH